MRRNLRNTTASVVRLFAILVSTVLVADGRSDAVEPKHSMRAVLVRVERISPEFLAEWKARGVSAVVVPLDAASSRRWKAMALVVERAGMSLWPWIEVARDTAMADAHPEWMAAIGCAP